MIYLLGALGLILLVGGGEALLRGSVALAARLRVSPMVIGLTLVGFGTSTPELVTSLQAALIGSPGIAVGNVVGSNIANILLILAVTALIAPIAVERVALKRDGAMLLVATLLGTAAILTGTLDRWEGATGLGLLAAYIVYTWRVERKNGDAQAHLHRDEAESVHVEGMSPVLAAVLAVGGLVMTIFGARLLVDSAVEMARLFEVSETVIGLTMVAIGTSLPELVASSIAAMRGRSDLALGNIVGSSIFNLLGILGVTALVIPVPVPPEILHLDLWAMIAATAVLLGVAAATPKLGRVFGLVLGAGYGTWIALLL